MRLASAWNIWRSSSFTTSARSTLTATRRRGMFCSYRKTSAKPPEPSTRMNANPGRFGGVDGRRLVTFLPALGPLGAARWPGGARCPPL